MKRATIIIVCIMVRPYKRVGRTIGPSQTRQALLAIWPREIRKAALASGRGKIGVAAGTIWTGEAAIGAMGAVIADESVAHAFIAEFPFPARARTRITVFARILRKTRHTIWGSHARMIQAEVAAFSAQLLVGAFHAARSRKGRIQAIGAAGSGVDGVCHHGYPGAVTRVR